MRHTRIIVTRYGGPLGELDHIWLILAVSGRTLNQIGLTNDDETRCRSGIGAGVPGVDSVRSGIATSAAA